MIYTNIFWKKGIKILFGNLGINYILQEQNGVSPIKKSPYIFIYRQENPPLYITLIMWL
jgi:hypothetical protein